jgi:hypothetical protein
MVIPNRMHTYRKYALLCESSNVARVWFDQPVTDTRLCVCVCV